MKSHYVLSRLFFRAELNFPSFRSSKQDQFPPVFLKKGLKACLHWKVHLTYPASLQALHSYKGGEVVRALASHQCGPGSNPSVDAICGLSLLLVLSLAPTGFLRLLRFSALLKSHDFHIPVPRGMIENEPLCGRATSIFFIFLTFFNFNRVCNILDNKTILALDRKSVV